MMLESVVVGIKFLGVLIARERYEKDNTHSFSFRTPITFPMPTPSALHIHTARPSSSA